MHFAPPRTPSTRRAPAWKTRASWSSAPSPRRPRRWRKQPLSVGAVSKAPGGPSTPPPPSSTSNSGHASEESLTQSDSDGSGGGGVVLMGGAACAWLQTAAPASLATPAPESEPETAPKAMSLRPEDLAFLENITSSRDGNEVSRDPFTSPPSSMPALPSLKAGSDLLSSAPSLVPVAPTVPTLPMPLLPTPLMTPGLPTAPQPQETGLCLSDYMELGLTASMENILLQVALWHSMTDFRPLIKSKGHFQIALMESQQGES